MRAPRLFGLALAASLAGGCAGPMFEGTILELKPARDPEVAKVATHAQQASLEVRQLSEQIEALNRSLEVLDGRVSRLESQQAGAAHTTDELAALRRDIQVLRAERETLRRDITDDLAARVDKIARQQSAAAAPAVRATAAPSAAVRATGESAARSGYEHRVEKGQTLSEIARGYGKSLDAIMKANKITNPSAIRVGQVLFIPD